MIPRPLIHGTAIVALTVLVATWLTTTTVGLALRSLSLLVVVVYLAYALVMILGSGRSSPVLSGNDLWDEELDHPSAAVEIPVSLVIEPSRVDFPPEVSSGLSVTETPGGVVVIRFSDQALLTPDQAGRAEIRRRFRESESSQRVIIDFQGVAFCLDALLLGMLIQFQRAIRRRGGELILCGISATAMEGFLITRLAPHFRFVATAEEALAGTTD